MLESNIALGHPWERATVSGADQSPWFAIYTKHQHEKTIAEILTSKGFEVFLPLYNSARQWKDRTKRLNLPLFPCYVFLHHGIERKLDIFTTPGVHSLVGAGGRPEPIPWSEIEAVRRTLEHGTVEPHPFLRCGDRVRVTSGPLEGLEGILVRKKNQLRVVVSIEILQQSVAAEVDACRLERVRKADGRGAALAYSGDFSDFTVRNGEAR